MDFVTPTGIKFWTIMQPNNVTRKVLSSFPAITAVQQGLYCLIPLGVTGVPDVVIYVKSGDDIVFW